MLIFGTSQGRSGPLVLVSVVIANSATDAHARNTVPFVETAEDCRCGGAHVLVRCGGLDIRSLQGERDPHALGPRDLDLDGEPLVRSGHRVQRCAVRELACARLWIGDELSRGDASIASELHGRHRRNNRGDHDRLLAELVVRVEGSEHLRSDRVERPAVAVVRGIDAVQLRAQVGGGVRREAQPCAVLHSDPIPVQELGRAVRQYVERTVLVRPRRRTPACVLVRHSEPMPRHARLLRRDGRRMAEGGREPDRGRHDVPGRADRGRDRVGRGVRLDEPSPGHHRRAVHPAGE